MNMTIDDATSNPADMNATRMTEKLKELQPSPKHRTNQLFAVLYPTIVEMLEKKVTQKAILEALGSEGLKLHPKRFKDLMAAEAQREQPESNQASYTEDAE